LPVVPATSPSKRLLEPPAPKAAPANTSSDEPAAEPMLVAPPEVITFDPLPVTTTRELSPVALMPLRPPGVSVPPS
jgi:hypothetical protein